MEGDGIEGLRSRDYINVSLARMGRDRYIVSHAAEGQIRRAVAEAKAFEFNGLKKLRQLWPVYEYSICGGVKTDPQ